MAKTRTPNLTAFQAKRKGNGRPCAMSLVDLTPQHTVDLEAALTTPSISGTVISEWLRERGYRISYQIVRRHRLGDCTCS